MTKEQPILDQHFLHLYPLLVNNFKNMQLRTHKNVLSHVIINKILDHLNSKSKHFCHLPFEFVLEQLIESPSN